VNRISSPGSSSPEDRAKGDGLLFYFYKRLNLGGHVSPEGAKFKAQAEGLGLCVRREI
jgi:hypothetical protein